MPFDAIRPPVPGPLVWDMVLPLAPSVQNDFALLRRFYDAGHSYVSLTIAGDDCGLAEATHRLAAARRTIARWPEHLVLVERAEDVLAAHASGRLAVGLHLEGTECLERDPDVIDLFYALGIRHAILAFNQNNSAAGGCADVGDVGLSRLGRRYLERMRAVGMLLDVSHMSERASLEAIELYGGPAIFSHSNVRALHAHYRNVTEQQARACATSGGVIGVSGSTMYLGAQASLAEGVFRHIDHLATLIGPEHVGLGTDYVADADALVRIVAARPDEWPEGTGAGGVAYMPPEELGGVTERMRDAGYGEDAITNILGGNWLRVARAGWQ